MFSLFIPSVYAIDDSSKIDINQFPQQLADIFGFPLFAGQALMATLFIMLFELPIIIWRRGWITALFTGILVYGFCVTIGWLPLWTLYILSLVVVLSLTGKIRNWIGGGGSD